jgi:hypothetical protein
MAQCLEVWGLNLAVPTMPLTESQLFDNKRNERIVHIQDEIL